LTRKFFLFLKENNGWRRGQLFN